MDETFDISFVFSVQNLHISNFFKKNLQRGVVFYRKNNYYVENLHICDIFYAKSSLIKSLS